MVNRFRPHVFILPEDDANRQVVNGFLRYQALSIRNIQVLNEVGGWNEVLRQFVEDEARGMERFVERFIVLLIDFDDDGDRLNAAKARIPNHLADRVFILGVSSEPEALKRAGLGNYERIGLAIAKDCDEGTDTIWGHELLQHNAGEVERLRRLVRPFLFPREGKEVRPSEAY